MQCRAKPQKLQLNMRGMNASKYRDDNPKIFLKIMVSGQKQSNVKPLKVKKTGICLKVQISMT